MPALGTKEAENIAFSTQKKTSGSGVKILLCQAKVTACCQARQGCLP
jgi:hypothetical protein